LDELLLECENYVYVKKENNSSNCVDLTDEENEKIRTLRVYLNIILSFKNLCFLILRIQKMMKTDLKNL
jgi:hypothetical protein